MTGKFEDVVIKNLIGLLAFLSPRDGSQTAHGRRTSRDAVSDGSSSVMPADRLGAHCRDEGSGSGNRQDARLRTPVDDCRATAVATGADSSPTAPQAGRREIAAGPLRPHHGVAQARVPSEETIPAVRPMRSLPAAPARTRIGKPGVPPVFCPPRLIATPDGDCPVEYLRAGDRVMTRDNGAQIIRWIGACGLTGADLRAAPHLHPILIPAGALAVGVPARDLLVSPNHRVLASSDKTALYFAQCEALVAAKHLVGLNGVRVADVPWMTYFHILFDRHQVVMSNGVWSESFQPEDQSLRGTDNSQRLEIFDLFPELEARQKRARSPGVGPQARPCREALLVTP